MSLFGSQSEVPNSPICEVEPYQKPWEQMQLASSLLNTAFCLYQNDSLPPIVAQEVWNMSPDFHGLAGLMELQPLELPAAKPEPDPITAAVIKDAEVQLKFEQDKLSAYQVKVAEKRTHKSKADQAKRTKQLEKEVEKAQSWLTMVSAY